MYKDNTNGMAGTGMSVVLAAGLGFVAGIMLAKKSGDELRQDVMDMASKKGDKLKQKWNEAKSITKNSMGTDE